MIITTRSPNVQYVSSLGRTNSNNCWYQAMKTRVLGLTQGISKQTHCLFPPVIFLCTVYLFLTYRKVTIICCVDIVKWTIKNLGTWALFDVSICMRILLFPFTMLSDWAWREASFAPKFYLWNPHVVIGNSACFYWKHLAVLTSYALSARTTKRRTWKK